MEPGDAEDAELSVSPVPGTPAAAIEVAEIEAVAAPAVGRWR
jgi:hypothetical protein